MTAVIYARYSTDSQREESIEGQILECTAYAEKNGFTVVKRYIDRAVSAKTDNRPQFQQMIKDSERGIFDVIIVWKLDRFARNRYDSARYKTQLKRNGVKLVSATEVISAGPEGIILESVLEGYAEYYSADLSEKVVRLLYFCLFGYKAGVRPLKLMPSSRWGIGRLYLSGSKCTISARILYGFKTCRGRFSLKNLTKSAEITG